MNDNRNRGWFLASLALAIASITVIAIPLLAQRGVMTGMSAWEGLGYRLGPPVAEALAIVGLIWMLRIWRGGERDRSEAWRYRDAVEPTPADEPRGDAPSDERPIADTRARGWLLARVELAIGAVVVLLIVFLGAPTFMGGPRVHASGLVVAAAAEVLAIAGMVWMIRIWHGPLRDQVPAWRYRR